MFEDLVFWSSYVDTLMMSRGFFGLKEIGAVFIDLLRQRTCSGMLFGNVLFMI